MNREFQTLIAFAVLQVAVLGCRGIDSGGQAQSKEQAPSIEEYRIEWQLADLPPKMKSSVTSEARVTFKNVGDRPIATSNLSLSYHWFEQTPNGLLQSVWDGIRTPVTVVVAPASSYSATMKITAPGKPGDFVLVLDLVRDGTSWFNVKGAPQFTRHIEIF